MSTVTITIVADSKDVDPRSLQEFAQSINAQRFDADYSKED